jgi:hypothetical protein
LSTNGTNQVQRNGVERVSETGDSGEPAAYWNGRLEASQICILLIAEWYTPFEKPCLPGVAGTADQLQREVAMEAVESAFSGPMLYILIAWGVVTAIFLLLIAWRSVLSSHEDDQIFIGSSGELLAKEQRELIAKIDSLSKPIMTSGIFSGVLLLLIAGVFVYHGMKNF